MMKPKNFNIGACCGEIETHFMDIGKCDLGSYFIVASQYVEYKVAHW